jgi:hypothetical protein
MLPFFDNRTLKPLNDFKISEDVSRSCILSYLAYLDPDLFYLKWESYKGSKKYEQTKRYYEKREQLANELFYGTTHVPVFYDGTINQNITKDAQAYKLEKDGTIYVAFRGSSSVFDFISDFDFIQVPFNSGNAWVHRGFKLQLESIKDVVFADCDPLKKTVFCGHSLGGGLATLAALAYKLANPQSEVSCITFGAPRIGNSGFASLFREHVSECARFVTEKDIVPVMSAIFEYVHVNDAYCMKDNKVYREEGDAHWTFRSACSLINIAKPIYMHSYNTYIHLVMSLLGNTA